MTAAREAILLPLLCLTVVLLGGLRIDEASVLVPPSLFALVLAVLLLGVLVQSGTLVPVRLMSEARSALANVNGFVLLAALFLACAQTFTLLTPASGLPRLLFGVYFLILMVNALAASPDRLRLLRSLAVTFGAAFVLNFVVIDALSDPGAGRMGRALHALFDSLTLGALMQRAHHPATGYLAFFTLVLFFFLLSSLPGRSRRERVVGRPASTALETGTTASTPELEGD